MTAWAWLGLVLLGLTAWWAWWRLRRSGVPLPPRAAPTPRSAILLNSHGVLDSVRTIFGAPPDVMVTSRQTYRLDRSASVTHWVYRAS